MTWKRSLIGVVQYLAGFLFALVFWCPVSDVAEAFRGKTKAHANPGPNPATHS